MLYTLIRVSSGTGKVLGLNKIEMETPPTCAYLMIGSRCSGECGFCAQSSVARNGDFLSRITWKPANDEEVYQAIAECFEKRELGRTCFQVVQSGDSFNETMESVSELRKHSEIPICVSINGISVEQVGKLIEAGVDRVAISFDAAVPRIYNQIKGKKWQDEWNFYEKCAGLYPGHIVVHMIIGLGETEEEAFNALENFYDHKTPVSLFAFTPLPGTPMSKVSPPDLASYRRVQVGHYLIRERKILKMENIFRFEKGQILFSEDYKDWLFENIPGEAFMTFGCSSCNRPLYNEKPGRIPYNYPEKLTESERKKAIEEIWN
jgi:lipoyl synthase